jgi:hypothetical protein
MFTDHHEKAILDNRTACLNYYLFGAKAEKSGRMGTTIELARSSDVTTLDRKFSE